jgi:hypothetical protein
MLNAAATPMMYREVNLKCCLLNSEAQDDHTVRARIARFENMAIHTKIFTFNLEDVETYNLDLSELVEPLAACQQLQRVW